MTYVFLSVSVSHKCTFDFFFLTVWSECECGTAEVPWGSHVVEPEGRAVGQGLEEGAGTQCAVLW